MEALDIICDEGMSSLQLKWRCPSDQSVKVETVRVRVACSDCVAELDVESNNWQAFADLFSPMGDTPPWSQAWISDSGEWKLVVQRDETGRHTVISELDSLLDYHPWKLSTEFHLSGERLEKAGQAIQEFIGQS